MEINYNPTNHFPFHMVSPEIPFVRGDTATEVGAHRQTGLNNFVGGVLLKDSVKMEALNGYTSSGAKVSINIESSAQCTVPQSNPLKLPRLLVTRGQIS